MVSGNTEVEVWGCWGWGVRVKGRLNRVEDFVAGVGA